MLLDIATGESEQDYLDQVRHEHNYWLSIRPQSVRDAWEAQGTWLEPLLLIDRGIPSLSGVGSQVIEGRTRIGTLQGRVDELRVAGSHAACVARRRTDE